MPTNKPAQYCFAQQRDSNCHIIPFINLALLNRIRHQSVGEIDLNSQADWYTKRDWLPEIFKWSRTWQQALSNLSQKEGGAFAKMQKEQLENGILNGHLFKENGKRVDDVPNPIKSYERLMLYPYNFTDAEKLPQNFAIEHTNQAYKTLPLVLDKGKLKCYDDDAHDYVALNEDNNDWDIAIPINEYNSSLLDDANSDDSEINSATWKYYKLNESQKKLLDLPEKTYISALQFSVLGFDCIFKYRYLPELSEKHSYYMSNLTQLILFGMGVDRDNNEITEDHEYYDAYCEFKNEMEKSPFNPWSLDTFNKEHFLEYQIAELIKKDPDLKKNMEDTVSILFPTWEYYKNVDNLFDENKNPAKDKKKHLMGDEQYLAYCYAQSARYLWAAATSRRALHAILDLDPAFSFLLRLPLMPGQNQIIRNATKKKHGHSFLSVWDTIKNKIQSDPNIPKELTSFSGHGVVMSFEEDLLAAQKNAGSEKQKIIDALGFAIIDSYYGDQLRPMYRQTNPIKPSAQPCNVKDMIDSNKIKEVAAAPIISFSQHPADKSQNMPLKKEEEIVSNSKEKSPKKSKKI